MGSVRIRIIWRSKMGNSSGHGEYIAYDEFMKLVGKLNYVGKTPQEIVEELNNNHPEIYHSIETEPYIAS
jgi:hypothetical protein